jgi:hypothetical protein
VADDDQQVEVGLVTVLGLVDPVAPRIGAEQDDLVDFAAALVRLSAARDRLVEFLEQDVAHAFQLVLLALGEVIKVGAHPD